MSNPLPSPEDEVDRRLLRDVQEHGWHIIHVGSPDGEDSEGPGWSYSIGIFHTLAHPEFIVVGLPWSTAQTVINDLGRRVRAGERFVDGTRDSEVLENDDVAFVTMSADQYREHVGYARWFYSGAEFPVLQIVWPDREGRFPWDAGYALDVSAQPILGSIPADMARRAR